MKTKEEVDIIEKITKWSYKGYFNAFILSRYELYRNLAEKYLKNHHFKYHRLLMGKLRGGKYHWIDNHIIRATRYEGKFSDFIEAKASIQVFEK